MLGASSIARFALAEAYVVFTASINETCSASDSFQSNTDIVNELVESVQFIDYGISVGVTQTRAAYMNDILIGYRTFTTQY